MGADFYLRYLAGDPAAVWAEVRAVVADDPSAASEDAELIAQVAVARLRANLLTVVRRLTDHGWPFYWERDGAEDESVLHEPLEDTDAMLRRLEKAVGGPLPIGLKAIWRIIGSIDIRPRAEEFQDDPLPDPLVLPSVRYAAHDVENRMGSDPADRWIYLPDEYQKAGFSAGSYMIAVPDGGLDPTFTGWWNGPTTLFDYLRDSQRYGFLPGWSRRPATPLLRELTAGLAAF